MKPLTYSFIAAVLACGFASAQTTAYTTPVGYVTNSLPPGQFTLVGLTLQNPTVSAGVLTAESPSSVTHAGVDFVALLGVSGSATYILELIDGTSEKITGWDSAGVLNTASDITAKVVPSTTTYKLRKAATVSSVFGATNSAGLGKDTDGSLVGTDYVLIPNASGGFDTIYYFDDSAGTAGWFTVNGDPADNAPIVYKNGIYVQRAASPTTLSLVVSGEVKTKPTSGVLAAGGYSYLNAVTPTPITLAESGLSTQLAIDTTGDINTADLVLVQLPNGGYITCYYFDDGAGTSGWFDDQGNTVDTQPLNGGFLIYNRGASKAYTVNVPVGYASL